MPEKPLPSYHVSQFYIPNKSHSFVQKEGTISGFVENLGKINIFIGENNSGKSRIMRDILNNQFRYIPFYSLISFNQIVKEFNENIRSIFVSRRVDVPREIADILKEFVEINDLKEGYTVKSYTDKFSDIASKKFDDNHHAIMGNTQYSKIGKLIHDTVEESNEKFDKLSEFILNAPTFTKIYIPILRGIRPLTENGYEDYYKNKTITDYFKDSNPKCNIFTGLSAYEEIKNHLLGDLSQRNLIKDYEDYLASAFFDNREVSLIPSIKTEHLHIKIGDEQEQPIFEMGDGLQSLLILTLPLFINRNKNVLVFIDEPEKLIHPGLQRKLINTLLYQKGFENFQYFITTHSNHFLDMTQDFKDISIYSFQKQFNEGEISHQKIPKFVINNLSNGDHNALELLGVRNSSVYLSNCTIWVEGITDRKYFRKYLEMYQKNIDEVDKYREDFHYSFVEYGGANITHWSFLDSEEIPINVDRLCGKIFLIADGDEGKEERHDSLKRRLEERYYPLPCREVENLLSKEVLLKVIGQYEKCEPKTKEFTENDYIDKYLGSFIDDILIESNRGSSYRQTKDGKPIGSGTIKDKIPFCEKALNSIETWDDLSENAKDLTVKIYEFVKKYNTN